MTTGLSGDHAALHQAQILGTDDLQVKGASVAILVQDADETEAVWKMIQRHRTFTGSERASKVLAQWKKLVPKFVKVMPKDYKRVLQAMQRVKQSGLSGDDAIMAAFEENARDVARVGGG